MPERELVIDHQYVFRLFLIGLLGYVLLWASRYAGYYLFGYWGSLHYGDPMTMILMLWVPLLLLFMIIVTLFLALGADGSRKDPYPRAFLYIGIFLALVIYFVWLIVILLTMGFS
ncbi:MAG: hypothetical protein AB9819_00585 [Methanomassiliicoccales archaeon]